MLTNRGRLYLVDMDARDVDKEIDLIGGPHSAHIEGRIGDLNHPAIHL